MSEANAKYSTFTRRATLHPATEATAARPPPPPKKNSPASLLMRSRLGKSQRALGFLYFRRDRVRLKNDHLSRPHREL